MKLAVSIHNKPIASFNCSLQVFETCYPTTLPSNLTSLLPASLSHTQPKVSCSFPTPWALLGAVLWQSVWSHALSKTHTHTHTQSCALTPHHMLSIIFLIPLPFCLKTSWPLLCYTSGRNVCVCASLPPLGKWWARNFCMIKCVRAVEKEV